MSAKAAGIRERNRAELTAAILAEARQQLAREGAAGISLRAVARELGMASSAVYRYFPSRDALLTQLIIEAYDSLGDAATTADARVRREDLAGRFRAIGRAVRTWALAHEHEYALIYGSPVPGYRAPTDTIPPASRVPGLLLALLQGARQLGRLSALPTPTPQETAALHPLAAQLEAQGVELPPELLLRGVMAWTMIFGAVSFELFGHTHNVVTGERAARSPFFDGELDRIAAWVGLD